MKPAGVVLIIGLACWAAIAVAAIRLGPFIASYLRAGLQHRRQR